LLFRRRFRAAIPLKFRSSDAPSAEREGQLFRIDFDMMLKGSIYKRRKGAVRQFGVTVNGSTRLVTSGDTVDIDTYKALLAAGAIRPAPADIPAAVSGDPAIVDCRAIERAED